MSPYLPARIRTYYPSVAEARRMFPDPVMLIHEAALEAQTDFNIGATSSLAEVACQVARYRLDSSIVDMDLDSEQIVSGPSGDVLMRVRIR